MKFPDYLTGKTFMEKTFYNAVYYNEIIPSGLTIILSTGNLFDNLTKTDKLFWLLIKTNF